jgi:RNA polymerase sigma factor (sigma-70 family)
MPGRLTAVLRYLGHAARAKECADQSDAGLLRQFVARRNEQAFAALLERHGPFVLAVCRRILRDPTDAEDAFQATFLVLARKAGSIRNPEALAAWLHQVALNMARALKSSTAQRQIHERQAALMAAPTPVEEVPVPDWQPILHEEVGRLPEKYRVPVVLCYLEGMTQDAAARQLGWPLGTVKGRLARARTLLRTRLTRRGIALTAGGLAAALAQRTALGKVPAALLGITLRAAVSFGAGETLAAGAVSAQAVALAKGALQTMTAAQLVFGMVVLVAVGGIGTCLFLYGSPGGSSPGDQPPPQAAKAPIPPPARADFGPEVKGLRAKVTLAKDKFQVGEAVPATYVVKNVSKEEQTLWHSGFWPNHLIVVKDADGKEPPLTEFGRQRRQAFSPGGERSKNVAVNVPAGGEDAAYEKYDLTKLHDLSRPGRYTVQYVYEEKQGGWEGRLPSNEAAFEVVAAKEDRRNVIEKDGVRFEILVPDRDWAIPEKPSGRTAVKLGLRITNKTGEPLRFTGQETLFPEIVGTDGKELPRGGADDVPDPVKSGPFLGTEADYPLLVPGSSTTFFIDTRLSWRGGLLHFGLLGSAYLADFNGLSAGRYKVRIVYESLDGNVRVNPYGKPLSGVWTGKVETPFVEVSLAPPAAAGARHLAPGGP